MKKLSVLFTAVAMFMAVGVAKAQKIAVLDVAAVLNAMPEKKKADTQLEAYSKTKQDEIKKQSESAQTLFKKYQEEAPKKTAEENKTRETELQTLSEKIQKLSQTAQEDFLKKRDEAYAPIEKKFNEAVSKAAKTNGWDFVIDALSQDFIFKNGPDAPAAVKKELGM